MEIPAVAYTLPNLRSAYNSFKKSAYDFKIPTDAAKHTKCIEQLIFMIYLYGFGQSPLLKSSSEEKGAKETFGSKRSDHGSRF